MKKRCILLYISSLLVDWNLSHFIVLRLQVINSQRESYSLENNILLNFLNKYILYVLKNMGQIHLTQAQLT